MKSAYIIIAILVLSSVASAQLDHDVGVSAIFSPPETTNIFQHHPITLEVTNFGTNPESFDLICDINVADSSEISFSDTIAIANLGPGAVDTITSPRSFSMISLLDPIWVNFYDYDVIAYSTLANDGNRQNDSTYKSILFVTEAFVIIGDRYGSQIDANIGSIVEIPVWGGTPSYNDIDSAVVIHINVSSDDTVISYRYPSIEYDPQNILPAHSYFNDSTIMLWNDRFFYPAHPDAHIPNWTNQFIMAICFVGYPLNIPFNTSGDTVLIGNYVMHTALDPALMGDTINALIDGWFDDGDIRGSLFGLNSGTIAVYPNTSYCPIRFMAPYEVGYIMGIITDPDGAPANGAVIRLIDAFREDTTDLSGEYYLPWITPGIYTMEFYHPDYGSGFVNNVEITAGDTMVVDYVVTDHDVSVSAIVSPPETTNIFLYHPIEIEITNLGLSTESFDIIFDASIVDSAGVWFSDTISVFNLAPGVTDTVTGSRTFSIMNLQVPPWTQFYEYDISAYSILAEDENPQNDSVYQRMVFVTESFVIVGDRLANPIDVNIGSIIEIPVWGGTPEGNDIDSVNYIHIPVASNDTVIEERYTCVYYDPQNLLPAHSYFPDTLIGLWDDRRFMPPNHDHPQLAWTNQSIEAYCDIMGGPNPMLNTSGDTVLIGTYVMSTAFDPGLLGEVVWPFMETDHPYLGELCWGLQNGTTPVFANSSYGPIRFLAPYELGYVMGTVADSGGTPVDGAVVSLTDAFREDTTDLSGEYYLPWVTPGIYSMVIYHPDYGTAFINDVEILAGDTAVVDFRFGAGGCDYLPGDANGNDNTNGLDVVYLVAYFKGGSAPPDQCDCPPHGIIYAAADANGSCATNGLDVTYMVSYFKGGSPITYCPDCPPQE